MINDNNEIQIEMQNESITLQTIGKFCDKNIKITSNFRNGQPIEANLNDVDTGKDLPGTIYKHTGATGALYTEGYLYIVTE